MSCFRAIAAFLGLVFAAQAATPRIDYVTYLGGIYSDTAALVAVDSSGAAYVTGSTDSPDFPLTSTAFGAPDLGHPCAFLTKLNPTGTAIEFSTCLAISNGLAGGIDASGNIYFLVLTLDAYQTPTGNALVKLDPTASTILYNVPVANSPYATVPEAIAVDGSGDVYLTGLAYAGLPTSAGAYQPEVAPGDACPNAIPTPVGTGPCPDAFVMKFSPSGALIYCTYLGGSGRDEAHAIAIDIAGDAWIAGETVSPNFPTTANALSTTFGGEIDLGPEQFGDGFVSELDPTGAKLLYSTYLGGSAADGAFGIAIDAAGSAYVVGDTQSADFPVTPGALQTTYTGANGMPCLGCGNGFVAKFSASGTLVYSTYLKGSADVITADSLGQAYVEAAQQPPVVVLNPTGSAIVATSPIGGGRLVLDGKGGLYTAGSTSVQVFFSTLHALQTEYGGGDSDGFVAKVDFTQPALPELSALVNAASLLEGNFSLSVYNGAVAPGEVVTLFGSGFGTQPTLSFDTVPAPILYASDTQINAVVPYEAFEPLVMTVASAGETIAVAKLPFVDAVPAIFTIDGSGTGQGAILDQDGTLNSASTPAARGSFVSLWMTGAGGMTTYVADGSIGPLSAPFPVPALNVSMWIDGDQAPVQYAGQAPGLVAGVMQVNFEIPLTATTGSAVPVGVKVGYFVSPSVTMAID
jgi:uncharacterized protein (TIGR03437 family)